MCCPAQPPLYLTITDPADGLRAWAGAKWKNSPRRLCAGGVNPAKVHPQQAACTHRVLCTRWRTESKDPKLCCEGWQCEAQRASKDAMGEEARDAWLCWPELNVRNEKEKTCAFYAFLFRCYRASDLVVCPLCEVSVCSPATVGAI